MTDLIASGFKFKAGLLSLLDQQKLPQKEEWISCKDLETIVLAIKALKVRGAPAIGIAACLFLLSELKRGRDASTLLAASDHLRAARPTAVNLMNYMDQLDEILKSGSTDWQQSFEKKVYQIFQDDIELCERIADHGLSLLADKVQILTHCNTGSIATAGRGTAIGIITKAQETNREVHVWVDETRPLLQGGRLTSWELSKADVPNTLICDSAAAMLMAQGKVDCVIVGADRIARNGDFANKIGTYSLAVLAKHHQVPFYIAAPETTIDMSCPSGSEIPIEERGPMEVRGVAGAFGAAHWAPEESPVYNPAFDVTPAELVSAWILDTGVRHGKDWR